MFVGDARGGRGWGPASWPVGAVLAAGLRGRAAACVQLPCREAVGGSAIEGSGGRVACNEAGVLLADLARAWSGWGGSRTALILAEALFAFQRGCELGFEAACGNYPRDVQRSRGFVRAGAADCRGTIRSCCGGAKGESHGPPGLWRCTLGLVGRGGCVLARLSGEDQAARRVSLELSRGGQGVVRRRSEKQRDGGRATPNPDATTGDEAELSATVDALHGSTDDAADDHVVLGMIFLKYIFDALEAFLVAVLAHRADAATENGEKYTTEDIFQMPPETLWAHLKAQAHQSTAGLTTYAEVRKRGGTIGKLGASVEGSTLSTHTAGPDFPKRPSERLRKANLSTSR